MTQSNPPRMVRKVTCVTTNKEQPSDYQYWITRPVSERIDAIEMLRQSWMSFQQNVPSRLQRVYRVTCMKNKAASGRPKDLEDLRSLE